MQKAQLKNDLMETLLLAAVHKEPGRCKAQYCRIVNGHGAQDGLGEEECYCKNFSCYANAWKRKGGRTKKPSCQFKKQSVWRRISSLAVQGLISITREKVKDRWMSRGWDWMKVCRPEVI